jgi:hypothetical protein
LIKTEQLTFVVNLLDPRKRPALILALYDTEGPAIATTIEGLRLIDSGPPAVGTGERALFELYSFFLFLCALAAPQ